MRGIPPDIAKALKELERLNGIARKAKGEYEAAEIRCRTQAAKIALLWKEHYDWLRKRLAKKGEATRG